MNEELTQAVSTLQERIKDTLSAMPTSAAMRRSPDLDIIVPLSAVDAVLAALTTPCTCREDVVCGACMSGATDPTTATRQKLDDIGRKLDRVVPTPPADDVRDLIAEARQWPRDGVNEGSLINALADALEFRPRGTVTDAECVDIANRAQMVTGRSIWPSTVRAVLNAAREAQR